MSRIIFKFYIKELGILAVILISKSIFAQMENRFELRTGYYHAVDFAGGPQICISHQAKIFSKDTLPNDIAFDHRQILADFFNDRY